MGWRIIDESESGRSRRWQSSVEWTLLESDDDAWFQGTLQWSLEGRTMAGLLTASLKPAQWNSAQPASASLAVIDGVNTWHVVGTLCTVSMPHSVEIMCSIDQVCPKVAENWIFAQALNCRRYAVKLEDMSWVDIDYYIVSRLTGQDEEIKAKNESLKLLRKLVSDDNAPFEDVTFQQATPSGTSNDASRQETQAAQHQQPAQRPASKSSPYMLLIAVAILFLAKFSPSPVSPAK